MGSELAMDAAAVLGTQEGQQLLICAVFGALFVLNCKLLSSVWPAVFAGDNDSKTALRWTNAERLNGAMHSTTTVLMAAYGLWTAWQADGQFLYDAPNSPVLALSLSITVGYFAVDTVAMWVRYLAVADQEMPVVFTLHHLACLGYAAACLGFGIGAQTAAVATVVGEVTNPMQNIWFLSKDCKNDALYAALSPIFTYFFVLVRVALTPLWSAHVISFCLSQPNSFGPVMGPAFALICALVNLGGVYWAWGLWKGYCKYQAKAKAKRSGAPAGKIE